MSDTTSFRARTTPQLKHSIVFPSFLSSSFVPSSPTSPGDNSLEKWFPAHAEQDPNIRPVPFPEPCLTFAVGFRPWPREVLSITHRIRSVDCTCLSSLLILHNNDVLVVVIVLHFSNVHGLERLPFVNIQVVGLHACRELNLQLVCSLTVICTGPST